MKKLNNYNIDELRSIIDNLDEQIISFIISRNEISYEIIKIKRNSKHDVFDKSRENQILNILNEKFRTKISINEIKDLYNVILKYSKYSHTMLDCPNKPQSARDILCFKPYVIAGPCTVESDDQMNKTISQLSDLGIKIIRGGTFKPRTSPDSFQGLESEGINLLRKYADKYDMFVVSEFLDEEQLALHYDSIDIIQIGSRNMMNFSFLKKVGKKTATDNKPVILKRGYGSTINEFIQAGRYITQSGNENVILCLRGIRTFEQIDSEMRNTPDLAGILELKDKTDLNVIFDPSHASGNSKYVIDLSKAALSLGADGVMIETHHDPENALVDGFQSITPKTLRELINFINTK